ncbi:MAG: hypothetical protein HOH19_08685 [Kordiimonadaceae bacterium]|nr:hypothetical protein [Kordiimonadaceae bacterium]MBT6032638.1 hypothetical protein [Kordiimonadaceae bacterium]MBT7581906.1 hypothetical protein [Kordiimonadaceae bacterium]
MYIKKYITRILLAFFLLALPTTLLAADEIYKPFIFAYSSENDMETTAETVRAKLTEAGFEISGENSPYEGVLNIVVTNAALQTASAASDFGTFAAAQRVFLTKMGDAVQVSYTNPNYMALAYRLESDLVPIKESLVEALGTEKEFGSKKGLNAKRLTKYRYMGFPMFTERFDKPDLLATYESHEEAVAKLEEGLAADSANVTKVYRIDVPGTSDTLFGVAIAEGNGGDDHIMTKIDFEDTRSSAHLPYEILVKDNEIYALGARFRIAISFPDLKMVGSHSFAGIMSAPGAIKKALKTASGNLK